MRSRSQTPPTRVGVDANAAEVLDGLEDAVILLDAGGLCVYANNAAEDLFELTAHRLSQPFRMWGDPLHEAFSRAFGRVAADGETERLEIWSTRLQRCFNVRLSTTRSGILAVCRDITVQKETKEARREEGLRLHGAPFTIGAGTFRWDFASETFEWDDQSIRLLGLRCTTPEGLVSFLDRVHARDRGSITAALTRAREGEPFHAEFQVAQSAGGWTWIELDGQCARDEWHEPLCVLGICRDVTRHKRSEDAREHQYRLIRMIAENAASCLFMVDRHGHATYMNPAAVATTGYTLEEVRDLHLHDAVHWLRTDGTPYPRHECPIVVATAQRRTLRDVEDVFQRKNGSFFPVVYSVAPLDETDEMSDTVLEVRDITAQKQAETLVREADRRKEELLVELTRAESEARFVGDASRVLAETLDYETTVAKVARLSVPFLADWCMVDIVVEHERVRRIAGAHVEATKEHLLRELAERSTTSPKAQHPAARALRARAAYLLPDVSKAEIDDHSTDPAQAEIVRALGPGSVMAVPIVARGKVLGAITFGSGQAGRYGPKALTLAEEVARRAAAAIEKAQLFKDAQDAIRARDEFLSIASHELRTPVTALLLTVQRLRQTRLGSIPEPVLNVAGVIERQVGKLNELIDQLLCVESILAGRLVLQGTSVDLAALVHDEVKRLAPVFARARSPVTVSAATAVLGTWDRDNLRRVVASLLDNAAKFGAGRPVEITVGESSDLARLDVIDHGIGIEAPVLPNIFERFGRGVAPQHYGGFGLGLYVVGSIVHALGGSVRAESAPDVETRFIVELPKGGAKMDAPA